MRSYMVSPGFYRSGDRFLEPDDPASIYPQEDLPVARSAGEKVARNGEPAPLASPRRGGSDWPAGGRSSVTDRMFEEIAQAMEAKARPRLAAVRYTELDEAGHAYLRYSMPREFGDVAAEDRRRYGPRLEAAYARVDAMVGRAMAALDPDDLLIIVSGYGMQPANLATRLVERALGNAEPSGSHEDAPDGFLLAWGRAVSPGRKQRASISDVTPTILYFLGMPVARDMDGYARTDIFQRDFTDDRPLAFIPTYEQ
jgi:arylsulfatase A-like enzyme